MLGVLVNVAAVVLGGSIGTLFGSAIKQKYTDAIIMAIALMTVVIGVQSAIGTASIMTVMICLVFGTIVGVALRLDDFLDSAADRLKKKLENTVLGKGRFADAFVSSSVLFCVGTMAVIGSINAAVNQDYSILIAKSIIDFVSAIVFSAALGGGVIFSAVSVFIIQGGIVMLADICQPLLTEAVITEMSAVGGTIFIGMSINLLGISNKKIKIGDMLPAIFFPIIYIPLYNWIVSLI